MKANVLSFIRELETLGRLHVDKTAHHFDLEDGSFICFKINRRGDVRIESLFAAIPKQGIGSRIMETVCQAADDFGVPLTLNATPFGPSDRTHGRISRMKLITWYRGFGFVTNATYYNQLPTMDLTEGLEMIRMPVSVA